MQQSGWYRFDAGSSIGESGSDNGIILRDEEYVEGARITLERDGYTPFAITCGIYGWMVHTCFFSTEQEANEAFESMKAELERIIDLIPLRDDPEAGRQMPVLQDTLDAFTRQFQ
jgi:hypothetical protein